ncbi:MAG: deoxynucleoside kinase [Oscillospiraceae bacterium]
MKGKLIVIEGLDGSGKATQAQFLYDRLKETKIPAIKISFPNYEDNSSALVKMYLAGKMGNINQVNVFAASTFYSVDRYATFNMYYKKQFDDGTNIVADRYTTSNIVHQGSKLPNEEQDEYINWLEDLEYDRMELPRPDLVLYMDMEPEIARELIQKRYKGNTARMDIHEADFEYMKQCRHTALLAAEKCGWHIVKCTDGSKALNAYEISEKIWDIVQKVLV